MVKKLLKHEATYYMRTLIIYEIVMFSLAVFTRLIMFFETDSIIYYLLQGSSFILFGLSIFGCLLMATVISVFRFYKNLFTTEGYLSFSLPVSTNQHIFAKLLWATGYNLIVFASAFVAALITISGDILNESIKAIIYLFNNFALLFDKVPVTLHVILYIIEFIIIFVVSTAGGLLIYYACIAIGQTAKKNRILLAVAVYFGYMMLSEILSTILSILMSIFATSALFVTTIENLGKFVTNHPFATIHIILIALLILNVIIAGICYIITHQIISKKLNLE